MIKRESIDRLKEGVDIVDVIGSRVELKKAGANYKCCCPFHGEKTPSFNVNPAKQIYHCFGCGVGGDAIKFVSEFERVDFVDAVEKLAAENHFVLEYDSGDRVDYSSMMDGLQRFYASGMTPAALKYLHDRGLEDETISRWGIGWAPVSAKTMQYITENHLPVGDLSKIGIIREGERGVYAHFALRVMFPVRDARGRVLGWSGRSLRSDAKAKYINSIDSDLFDKSRILFGMDRAKDAIRQKGFAVLMEGQMDVILSHQAGIRTAVSAQGTALTEQNAYALKKIGCKVVIAYDGDNAGKAAALKSARVLSGIGVQGRVASISDGCDPADMVASGRVEELKSALIKGVGLVEYVLGSIASGCDRSDPYSKAEAMKEAEGYCTTLGSSVLESEYVAMFRGMIGGVGSEVSTIRVSKSTQTRQSAAVSSVMLLLYYMYVYRDSVDSVLDIVDTAAWGDRADVVKSVLDGSAADTDFAEVIAAGVYPVSAEQIEALALAVQRRWQRLRRAGLEDT